MSDDFNPPPDFHVSVDTSVQPPCVVVWGELELVTCAAFRDALSEAAEVTDKTVAVDFSHLTFLGSTGIRELVRLLERVDRIDVRGAAPIVRRAFEAAGLPANVQLVD